MSKSVIINGVTYNDVPQVKIPISGGGNATFYETSDADAAAGDILTGKKSYGSGGLINGSMANNGSTSGTISTKAGTVSIPAGYTSGGTVSIRTAQQNLLVSGNIKSGVTVLGVSGSSMVLDTTLASGAAGASNILSGYSAFVNGAKVDGTATVPTVAQDSSTHVLTIS